MADFPVLGLAVTGELFTACTSTGDTFQNDQAGTTVLIRNKNANARTLVFASPNQCCFGLTSNAHDLTVTIPGNAVTDEYVRLRIEPTRFNNANGQVSISYSTAVAGLSIAVIAYAA